MCGIAGFTRPDVGHVGVGHCNGVSDDASGQARALLQRMIATLEHRGPDGRGFFVAPGVALGHARLAIVDLVTGQQPIHNPTRDVWTICNGEIFNYVELRAELEAAGHVFYTRSDTEVIVHLYDRYGEEFLAKLNGQFAIALWDARNGRLLLARDRTGIRPLFHARGHGRVWFASEVKALLSVLPDCAVLEPEGLVQTFTYWSTIEPQTVYRGVSSLPPGCLLTIERDGSQTLRRYWDWSFPSAGNSAAMQRNQDPAHAAAQLRELLVDAVRLQLRADVPVCAYLSGGLDSSGLIALAQQLTGTPVRTYSVAFEDAEFDESDYQQAMVRHLGTEHSTVHCSRLDIGAAFPRYVRHAEVPVLRTAPVPLMLLSAKLREQGYKVVLSGEGADEVFGGYDLFKEAKVRRFWARQPNSRLRPRLLERLYGYLPNSPVGHPGFAQAFFGQGLDQVERPVFAHLPRWIASQRALVLLSPELRAAVHGWDPLEEYEHSLPQNIRDWSGLARDQYIEAKSLLAGYLLSAQGDRVAMANSVEGRFPYLDHRVVEFGNHLPPNFKLRGLTEKYLLRRALADLLPAEIAQRPKQPYRAPDGSSFFVDGEPLDYVAELMGADRIRAAGYFDSRAVARLLEKCRAGRALGFADHQAFVGVLSTMLVHDSLRPGIASRTADTTTLELSPAPLGA